MDATDLTLFSLEILGLVGRDGAAPHDLRRMAQNGRMLAWAGESQYYTEPKRLARLGYLDARKEPGKTRERTVYTLTDQGLAALRAYARTPVTFTPLKSDALLRLLVCDLVGEEVTRASMSTLREDLADIAARLDDAERARARPPAPGEVPAARHRFPAPLRRAARGSRRRGRAGAWRVSRSAARGRGRGRRRSPVAGWPPSRGRGGGRASAGRRAGARRRARRSPPVPSRA